MNIGDAFLLPTPPNGNHLFFAIAITTDSKYLCVNATSLKSTTLDTACILKPGAGVPSFIVHDSAIVYRRAREISPDVISRLIASGKCIYQGCCSEDIVKQIQQGALASRQISNEQKQVVQKFLERL